jgi:hypothetical protein
VKERGHSQSLKEGDLKLRHERVKALLFELQDEIGLVKHLLKNGES